ncbi:MAG: hypothetical protein IPM74_06615 [Crocinitomicaceae bacterium]|nr:hypothetical protein [Crocinitomicaceae bacterium]MBK8925571.1 hypothetical protein [Crocinitomicaceae bacterium]
MKFYSYVALLLSMFFVSCKKEEMQTTSFQIKSTNYFTGDSIANCKFYFRIDGQMSYFQTNAFGYFDTIISHPVSSDVTVGVASSSGWLANDQQPLLNGENNQFTFEVIPYATLTYHFDCTAPGNYQCNDVNHQMLDYPSYGDPHFGEDEVDFNGDAFTGCYSNSSPRQVFATDYVISYWLIDSYYNSVQYLDTITLQPGEEFIYTIEY